MMYSSATRGPISREFARSSAASRNEGGRFGGTQKFPWIDISYVIRKELAAWKCVVVIWSRKSISSEWVEIEAAYGKRKGILVPALIDDVTRRIPLEFSRFQAASLIRWDGHRRFVRIRSSYYRGPRQANGISNYVSLL